MSALMLMFVLATASPPAVAGTSPEGCPPPVMAAPLYPFKQLKSGVSGTTVVLARIDDCGRVLEAKVDEGSGHAALDAEALLTVRGWVLSEDQRAQVGGPWVKMPVRFLGSRSIVPKAPDWPRSHRRPTYLADDQPIGFETIAAFHVAEVVRSEPMLKSPYGSTFDGSGNRISTAFMADATDPRTFWLAYSMQAPPAPGADGATRASPSQVVAAARYRLVVEDGGPVVRVGLLCERAPDECSRLQAFLIRGLPIARAAGR